MNLPELQQKALNFLSGFFHEHDTLPTTFFGLDREERLHLLMATGWAENKEFCRLFLTSYFLVNNIEAYACASEAWMGTATVADGQVPDDMPRARTQTEKRF